MAMNPRISFIFLMVITVLLPLVISGRNPRIFIALQQPQLKEGDLIPLFANKVFPRASNGCEPYSSYELPFCPPGDPTPNRKKSLEEIISGDCFTRTRYELKFKVSTVEKVLCEKTLTKDEVKKFREAVRDESEYDMYYNKIFFRRNLGFAKRMGGSMNSKPKYYLVKHIDFFPQYYENQVADIDSTSKFDSAVDITEDAELRVNFTYSVFWEDFKMTPTKSTSKNRTEMIKEWWNSEEEDEISMITRLMFWLLHLCLPGLPLLPLFTPLPPPRERHPGRNSREEGLRPAYPRLLAAILGIGTQQLVMIIFLLIADFNDITYPCYLGPLTTLLAIYCLICLFYGYRGALSHVQRPQNAKLEWKENLPRLAIVLAVYKAVKFGFEPPPWFTIAILSVVFWLGTALFLPMGVAHAYSLQIRRRVNYRRLPRFLNTPWQMFLGGLLPFIVIFTNLNEIFASLLFLKVCGVSSTMLSSSIIVMVTTVLVGAGCTICQMNLPGNNFNWWWRSVLRGGSTAMFMFAYGIYFHMRVDEKKYENLYMFSVYNACLSCVFFLVLGATGFYASQLGSLVYYHWAPARGNR